MVLFVLCEIITSENFLSHIHTEKKAKPYKYLLKRRTSVEKNCTLSFIYDSSKTKTKTKTKQKTEILHPVYLNSFKKSIVLVSLGLSKFKRAVLVSYIYECS